MPVTVALAQINSIVGDLVGNCARIVEAAHRAAGEGADIVLTPELSLVGYPPEDLLLRESFYAKSHTALQQLAEQLAEFKGLYVIVGHPLREANGQQYNAASVMLDGAVIHTYRKHALPNYTVFDEKRYFSAADDVCLFDVKGTRFAINICEDTWYADMPRKAREAGAQVMLVLNASPFHMHKQHLRIDTLRDTVSKQQLAMVYLNLVGAQDELVFDGASFVLDADGGLCAQLKSFEEDFALVQFEDAVPQPLPLPAVSSLEAQVYSALVLGVRDYVGKNGFPGAIIGLSGGVDSALTLAIAVDALGKEKVRAVMMPSPYTAEISWIDSRDMAARLGVRYDEIPIASCFDAFRDALQPLFAGLSEDTTEENLQARIRGTLLMALSNKTGAIVLTTGNKSEMATGYCTLYGDMAGGYAVIKDILKTMVYRLCDYRNAISEVIPQRILTRAPSAELRPNQLDQDSLPPYEVLDGILRQYMEEGEGVAELLAAGYRKQDVDRITRLVKINEYKRRQAPVGPRITHRAFGRDWRYPITSKFSE
jgi:NAD+ synthase (glutamine-hydrolysing)